jgi:hypothetical protein
MNKILVLSESLNRNKTSEGIATVNFLNSLDTSKYDVFCLFYEFPQFELEKIDWINPQIHLIQIKNDQIDYFLSEYKKLKNFFSRFFGISILKEYRVFRFRKKLNTQFADFKLDLIFSRTVATSVCSHRALISSNLWENNKILIYFNDPVPFSLMPAPYSNGNSYNPKFDIKEIKHVKKIISKSTFIASPSKLLNDFFIKVYGTSVKPTFIFPHLYSFKGYNLDLNCLEYLNPNKINITHCGSLLTGRDPSYLVYAIADFLHFNPEFDKIISLNFFGPLHGQGDFFKNLKYDFIQVIDRRISHELSLALMYQSDLPVIIESSSDYSPFMPVKLAEMIGLGKIFLSLSPMNSEVRRLLGDDYNFQTEAFNKDEIRVIISNFLKGNFDLKKNETVIENLKYYVSSLNVNKTIDYIINI